MSELDGFGPDPDFNDESDDECSCEMCGIKIAPKQELCDECVDWLEQDENAE
jgi:hypothetical protein